MDCLARETPGQSFFFLLLSSLCSIGPPCFDYCGANVNYLKMFSIFLSNIVSTTDTVSVLYLQFRACGLGSTRGVILNYFYWGI